jgi:hypothetical protein
MKRIIDYSLIFFNCILLVLILFESSIQLPFWLVPSGRLHPLVLHLPIGLWAAVIVLFLLRKRISEYMDLSRVFWGITALGAAVTALVGMILAIGGDYESSQISNHKYSGVALSVLLWLAVIFFERIYQKPWVYVLISVLLIAVGHWGGELTHGENYFPITSKNEPANPENVYQSLVQPILKEKCSSCHNSSKTKGGLNLETVELMLKGGENGTALVSGNALESHMIKLILLPLDDKMHMPPKQKSQLTESEIEVLTEWINSGASENLTFGELKSESPLQKYFKPNEKVTYSFSPASEKSLEEVNTPFCSVKPLAVGSPALQASFFVSGKFDAKQLEVLLKVKKQLVELNLSKMPVKDEQLKVLTEFKKLETLNLSNTDVNGSFLEYIKDHKHLKSLSLANTHLSKKDIKTLSKLSLLYIWEAGFSAEEIAKIKKENPDIRIDTGSISSETMPINPPESSAKNAFVEKGTVITLKHALPNTQIKYTLDGTEPDSVKGTTYKDPILINNRIKIRAKATKQGWLASQTAEFDYLVSGARPDSVYLRIPPNPQYAAKGAKTLIDKRKGDPDNFLDRSWLGYREKPFEAVFLFEKGKKINNVTVSMMEKLDSYIFPPKSIEIWGKTALKGEVLLAKLTPEQPKTFRTRKNIFFDLRVPTETYTEIRITVNNINPLPQWHPGKGSPAWAFIDEVIFN